MQARYYLPSAGRFISADTIVPDPTNPQQFNRYTYVLNNPLRYTDPTGHYCYDPSAGPELMGTCINEDGTTYSLLQTTGREPINLQEWEMQLIAMVAYFEASGVADQIPLVIWTIINRVNSPAFSNSVEDLLVGTQYHISLRNPNTAGIYQHGIFAPYKDPNRVGVLSGQALSDAAFKYYSGVDPRLHNAMNDVRNAINAFNSSGADPTKGAVYFAHGDQVWAERATSNLRRQAEIDGLSNHLSVTYRPGSSWIVLNNIYDPPYGKYPFSGGYCTAYAISICQLYLEK
jgi:hypothetical protein